MTNSLVIENTSFTYLCRHCTCAFCFFLDLKEGLLFLKYCCIKNRVSVGGLSKIIVPSTAALEVKSQKSKDLYSRLLRHLEWYVYLRRAVLVDKKSGFSLLKKYLGCDRANFTKNFDCIKLSTVFIKIVFPV
jgi:hypothetical protein